MVEGKVVSHGYIKLLALSIGHLETEIIMGRNTNSQYDIDAFKALKKYRRRKSFQFSLHGWMEMHTVLIDLGTESVTTNGDGRLSGKFLKSVLHPKKRRGIRLFK